MPQIYTKNSGKIKGNMRIFIAGTLSQKHEVKRLKNTK